jgi:rubrerythrin
MALIDFGQIDLDHARLVSQRYWHCPRSACNWAGAGEIEGPEYCPLCETEALPGSPLGFIAPTLAPEGRWWECPTCSARGVLAKIWYGSVDGPERCPDCHVSARPSQFEGVGPHER